MKNIFTLWVCSAWLAACVGNPPAWWNPGNRYGTTEETSSVQVPVKRTQPQPKEEKLELLDESYEEIVLTPIQDEDGENITGASSNQSNESLPSGDSLPTPSVLE